jgi:hypothetical protein
VDDQNVLQMAALGLCLVQPTRRLAHPDDRSKVIRLRVQLA